MKKQIVRLQLNKSQTRPMILYWKRKPTCKKDLITYNKHPWIMFCFDWLVIIWRGGFAWNWTWKVKRVEEFWTLMYKGVVGSWKLGNFHGSHMCIALLGIDGHGDRSTKPFGGHKRCYDGQWPITGCYFNLYTGLLLRSFINWVTLYAVFLFG